MLLPIETLWSDKHWQVIQAIGTLPDGRVKKAIRVKRPDAVHLLAFPLQNYPDPPGIPAVLRHLHLDAAQRYLRGD